MDIRKMLFVFIPALVFLLLGLAFRIHQYTPLSSNKIKEETKIPDLVPLLAEDPIQGERKAPITVVAFEDLACAGCKIQAAMFDELLKEYPGQIKIIWKLLNVTTFPHDTELAHNYAFCAHEQGKFLAFKDGAFANITNLSKATLDVIAKNTELNQSKLSACLASDRPTQYQEKTKAIAKMLHIQSVPALFMNNKQISTPPTLDQWKALLTQNK